MIYIVLNAFAILAATLAGVAVGTAYQTLWGQATWLKDTRITALATVLVCQAWLCAILAGALILAPAKGSVWTMTIGSAVVIWLGFVAPSLIASYRYRAIGLRMAMVDCGYWLIVMMVQAIVLRLVGLAPPPV